MAINYISGNILANTLTRGYDLSIGSVLDGNLIYVDVNNNRIGVRTASPQDELDIAGVLRVGNVTISNIGNINAGSTYINNLLNPVQPQDAVTKQYVDSGLGNLTFSNTTISTSLAVGNITLRPTGNATAIISTTSGLVLPVGNTSQRPSPASTGTARFNSDSNRVEIYDGSGWEDVAANVTNQTLYGDGSTTVFLLNYSTTTASALVMVNGIVQLPVTAYSVSGNTLTFQQAPTISDVVDVRFL